MINSLTSFRFITAFIVFLFHCYHTFGIKFNFWILDKFVANGAVFMTGFFVLSGFIMTHTYQKWDFFQRKNIFKFYLKRFAKVYPVYAISTIIFFIFINDFTLKQYARIIINDIFLIQAFFPSMFDIGLNGGTWSLSVEIFLYFLFPFFIILFCDSYKILLITSLIIAAIISINITLTRLDFLYANPILRCSDFLTGMGFYFLCQKRNFGNSWHLFSIIGLVISVILLGGSKYWYMKGHLLFVPLFGLWISCVYFSKLRFYENKILIYLGKISYSFYIWQFVVLHLGKNIIRSYPQVNLFLIVLGAFFLNVLLSTLSYHFLEENFRVKVLNLAEIK